MQKPLTRRGAFRYICAAVSAPAVGVMAPQVAAARGQDGEPIPQGYGRCSLCACPAYYGSGWVCDNCGHAYAAHW
jgi:hypothetical protein